LPVSACMGECRLSMAHRQDPEPTLPHAIRWPAPLPGESSVRERLYIAGTFIVVLVILFLLLPLFIYLGIDSFTQLTRDEVRREASLAADAAAARIDRHLQSAHDRLRRMGHALASRTGDQRECSALLRKEGSAEDSPFDGGVAFFSSSGQLLATAGEWHNDPSALKERVRESVSSKAPLTAIIRDGGAEPVIVLVAPLREAGVLSPPVAVGCIGFSGPRGLAASALLPTANRLAVSQGATTAWHQDPATVGTPPAATHATAAGWTVAAYPDEGFLARSRAATRRAWFFIIGGGLFIAMVTTAFLMWRLVIPLISLTSQLRRISADDGSGELVTIDPRSDVADIARAFNRHMELLAAKERQLADQHGLLSSILDTASVGICAFDPAGRFTLVNRAYCQLTGYSAGELIGQPLTFVLPPETRDLVMGLHREFCAGTIDDVPPTWESQNKDGSRTTVDVRISRLELADGGILVVLVAQDLSELQRSLDALTESERRYRDLAELLPQTVFEADLAGRITFVNQQAFRIFGYTAEDVRQGLTILETLAPEEHERARANMGRTLRGENTPPAGNEYTARRRDGTTFPILIHSAPLYRDGTLAGTRGILIDLSDVKRAETELLFRDRAIASSINGIAFANAVGLVTSVNRSFLRMWGYVDAVDVVGREAVSFWEDPEEAAFAFVATVTTGSWIGTMTARRRDGSIFDAQVSTCAVFDEGGVPLTIMASFIDISEQMRTENALRQSEEKFRAIVETTQEWIWASDLDLRHTYSNPAIREILGFTPEEICASSVSDLIHPDDLPVAYDVVQAAMAAGTGWKGTVLRWRHKAGGYRYLESNATPVVSPDGALLGFRGADRDISKRMAAEEALIRSEERYRTLFEEARDAIIILRDGCIVECNPQALKLFRCTFDEILGHPPTDFSPPRQADGRDSEESARQKIGEALAGIPQHFEWRLRHADGTETDVEAVLNRVECQGGDELMAIGRDVTLRKQQEEALRVAKLAADAASRAKSDFLANMSHEIRTPLTAIIGFTDLIQVTEDREAQHRYLEMIRTSSDILKSIISDVLDLAKIEAGKLELETIPFSLAEVIDLSTVTHAVIARQKGVAFSIRVDSSLPSIICGDPEHLRQVLVNLVSNAVKFTAAGEIVVDVSRPGSAGMNLPGESSGTASVSVHFSVRDTGIGIPPEKQDAIFDSFTQADGTTTRRYGGTGLGTTIAKGIVELMGGCIWLESVPGEGSTFHVVVPFWLPAHDAGSRESGSQLSIAPPPLMAGKNGRWRILMVEDNTFTQQFMVVALARYGHEVTIAGDGTQAVDLWAEEPFDLVLMDVQLPLLSGLDATREIRRREAGSGRHTTIIAMTANALTDNRTEALAAGMDDYLTKPVAVASLMRKLLGHVPEPAAPGACRGPSGDESSHPLAELFCLEEMAEAVGDALQLQEYARLLLMDVERALSTMQQALQDGEPAKVRRAAHFLRGVAMHLRDGSIGRLASLLEHVPDEESVTVSRNLAAELQAVCAELTSAIRAGMTP
jgi:PAS domain S-box-containing protein